MKVILLDGNSFCYRAFYAVRELRNSKGQATNAVYGFITMLEKLIKAFNPDGVALTFDLKGPTFRHKRYDQYKIQRPPMPEDLVSQMPIIKAVVQAMNIPIFEKEGYEADDVMGTIARKLELAGHETFIVTSDKDALQLVNKKIRVLNPQKENFIYDEAAVKNRFGVMPKQVVEIMALMGDAADNIPGVPGIGGKTAGKLISEFGSLEGVLKNISKIKSGRLKANLETYQAQARLSRELAQIDSQVPIAIDPDQLKRRAPDTEKLEAIYQSLEFRSLLKRLPLHEERNADDESLRYHLIRDKKSFADLAAALSKEKAWAFDFETTGTDALMAEPIGLSFSFKEKEAYYVSFGKGALLAAECLKALKDLFEEKRIKKIGQNLKYEMRVLRNFGIRLEGLFFDTMIASYCLNPAKPNHNLDDIAMEHLGLRITSIKELIGSGKSQIPMEEAAIDRVYRYGCQDSDITRRLSKILGEKLEAKDLMKLFHEIEMPLVSVLADMECEGIAIDEKLLGELSHDMEKGLTELTGKIYKEAGKEFNINSPKQLAKILFELLRLPVVKKTKTGASTDVEVLQELAEIHSLPREILKYRELAKLKSTYVDALPLLVNSKTKRVHTSFNQTVTATGRLSSSDPNMQNIPVRTQEGRKIRRAFVAGSRQHVLVSADYSQIELRVLAHLSKDKHLVQAFKDGADIHRYTASLIFNIELEQVTEAMRDSAKTVNFGVLYGMGAFSLAKSLRITNEAAGDFIKSYFERYPRVKQYLEETLEIARTEGYVSTFFKRRRYIPEILSKDIRMKKFAERTAINMPIQGTASDIIKIAMREIAEKLSGEKFASKMILQVHDELLFEVPKDELKDLVTLATREMQGAVAFDVPMKVSVKAGPNWLDMNEINDELISLK
ncbi:MAG: DNA polymerase I [Candidatus Omnitrophica bacterium CG1_02_49_16]|nr:MAG: DNA polymerase I [Candidatus Omnitrophica bacterium CG1_02_49_16]